MNLQFKYFLFNNLPHRPQRLKPSGKAPVDPPGGEMAESKPAFTSLGIFAKSFDSLWKELKSPTSTPKCDVTRGCLTLKPKIWGLRSPRETASLSCSSSFNESAKDGVEPPARVPPRPKFRRPIQYDVLLPKPHAQCPLNFKPANSLCKKATSYRNMYLGVSTSGGMDKSTPREARPEGPRRGFE